MAMTRRKWLTTMGSGTLAAGVGAIAARGFGALGGGSAHHFQAVPATGAGSPRAVLQQKHLLNLPLVTQDGKSVKFYDDLVKGKKVVLTFMNTDPAALGGSKKVSQNLSELQKFFGSRMGKDIHFYTITANPQRDTPAVLKNWASQYSSGAGWTFLTGSAANVDKLRHSLGFADEFGMDQTDPNFSVGVLRYGTEPEMRWAHCQSLAAPRVIAHAMLLDFGTDPAAVSPPPVWNCSKLVAGLS
jgi:protein SCO1/2